MTTFEDGPQRDLFKFLLSHRNFEKISFNRASTLKYKPPCHNSSYYRIVILGIFSSSSGNFEKLRRVAFECYKMDHHDKFEVPRSIQLIWRGFGDFSPSVGV